MIVVLVYYNNVYNAIIIIFKNRDLVRDAESRATERADHRHRNRIYWKEIIVRIDCVDSCYVVVPDLAFARSRERRDRKEDRKEDRNSVQNAVRECNRASVSRKLPHTCNATRTSARRATAVCTDPV